MPERPTLPFVTDTRGAMVALGLGNPVTRAFVAGSIAAGVAYSSSFPQAAFREDGTIKPFKWVSPEPDATLTHFLLFPLVVAGATFLFT
ncbi:hypothetical protein [Pleurochrysis sp. endemic virus 1b]|nr:hypothetical protein [Pleurochrysis sp. endemic virus 1b]